MFLTLANMGLYHAMINERGEYVHQQDGEHHAFGIAFVERTDEDGEHADEQSIDVFAFGGVCGSYRVSGHEDCAEEETAHKQLLVACDGTQSGCTADEGILFLKEQRNSKM